MSGLFKNKISVAIVTLIFCISCNKSDNVQQLKLHSLDLYRIKTGVSTIGILTAPKGKIICYTLENNKYKLQAGNYEMFAKVHKRYGRCVLLGGSVAGRGFYLHCGNLVVDSRGCILVADSVISTNRIFRCRPALDSLYKIAKSQQTFLNIIER